MPLYALAADFPALTGRVVDNAGLIDAASEVLLTQKLEDFEKKGSDQIVVATVPSLGGQDIETYANGLFRFWKLGQAGENNGVLLLVAKDDRKMRIEVGYGLEGTLTDLHTKLIIENDMVPAFRNLVEYHAELLYARERTGSRIVLLCLLTALKAGLISLVMTRFVEDEGWASWMNLVFGLVYLASAGFTYRLLALRPTPALRTGP